MPRAAKEAILTKNKKFAEKLLPWFEHNGRQFPWRLESDPYRILVAEKMLQQTDVGHVMKVYDLFLKTYPDMKALAAASQDEVERLIKPLGFWRIRARDFKRMAQWIESKHNRSIPSQLAELDEIPGVGRYVSAAMSCFCFGKCQAIVDVNIRRILQRLFFWGKSLPSDAELESIMLYAMPKQRPKDFNWALLDFSAQICRKNPRCDECFATSICDYYKSIRSKS